MLGLLQFQFNCTVYSYTFTSSHKLIPCSPTSFSWYPVCYDTTCSVFPFNRAIITVKLVCWESKFNTKLSPLNSGHTWHDTYQLLGHFMSWRFCTKLTYRVCRQIVRSCLNKPAVYEFLQWMANRHGRGETNKIGVSNWFPNGCLSWLSCIGSSASQHLPARKGMYRSSNMTDKELFSSQSQNVMKQRTRVEKLQLAWQAHSHHVNPHQFNAYMVPSMPRVSMQALIHTLD